MSGAYRVRGVRVLKAVSSPVRLKVLNLLFDQGNLSYTELMNSLDMDPTRDAGRFAYHLKFLLNADLLEADQESRKYGLTELGKMVIDVADRVEKKALKPRTNLVRTSYSSLEEFDATKIVNALVKEAKMPTDMSQKVAKEAEQRLLKSKIKYLTTPLVREVVNGILVEKGLEDYRHRLTRLGLPVHEVRTLIEEKSKLAQGFVSVQESAGKTVLKEYALLNLFQRDVADAYLTGTLHMNDLGNWPFKPETVSHDLRFFIHNASRIKGVWPARKSAQGFASTLSGALNVLIRSAQEVRCSQILEYFNVFLAPFAKGLEPSRIKEALRVFIFDAGQNMDAALALELTIPDFLAEAPCVSGCSGENRTYGDYVEEAQLISSLLFDVLSEESATASLFNPKVMVKVRPETFSDKRAQALLLKAHVLSSTRGIPFYECLFDSSRNRSTFSAYGHILDADLHKDWETDTLRTGTAGSVSVNIPRIVHEMGKDKNKIRSLLSERLEMAVRALELKHTLMERHSMGLLPFLMQKSNGETYFRPENCSHLINLIGLGEAEQVLHAKGVGDEAGFDLVQEANTALNGLRGRLPSRLHMAVIPDFEAAERMAQLDIDRYGLAKAKFLGTRNDPYYSTNKVIAYGNSDLVSENESRTRVVCQGGGLTVAELYRNEPTSEELVAFTHEYSAKVGTGLLTYARTVSRCGICGKDWFGVLHKCPSCGAMGSIEVFSRFPEKTLN